MRARGEAAGIALVAQPERVEASLWRRFVATQDGYLRENLFDRYQRFASSLARRYARRNGVGVDIREDLEQFAYHGLLEAIDRYDPQRGAPFLSFATARIAGSIIDGMGRLNEFGAQVRFRKRIERERLSSLCDQGKSSRSATDELAELVTELALGLMMEAENKAAPSDMTGRSDNGFDTLAWRETQALLQQRVEELPEPERSVIRQHYQNDMVFAQIATMLGLTRGRISQLHKAALVKLRKSMRIIR
jgi:RNA polymerase sigma factor FliA